MGLPSAIFSASYSKKSIGKPAGKIQESKKRVACWKGAEISPPPLPWRQPLKVKGLFAKERGRLQKWRSDPKDLGSVSAICCRSSLPRMERSWNCQSALLLHPLNNPESCFMTATGNARMAVDEQSSHLGILLKDHFAQQLRFCNSRINCEAS